MAPGILGSLRTRLCSAALALVIGGVLVSPPADAEVAAASEATALQVAHDLSDGKYAAARARFDEALRRQLTPVEIERMLEQRRRERGPATAVRVLDRKIERSSATITVQCAWSRGASSELLLTVVDGAITHLQSWDDDDPLERYQTKAELRPPFKGSWTAGNAARDMPEHNYSNPHLRFAIDWLIRDRTGRTFRNGGKRNSDYYAYGQPALAPAPGSVVISVDGVPDNASPGKIDPYDAAGNYVVVDLGRGEYAMLMHLMPRSIRVRTGQHVVAGQMIGRAGNSGHCTEPNLQFQLADNPRLAEAHSLPSQFTRVLLDGEQAMRARPVYGSVMAPAEHWKPNGPMREPDDD